MTVVDFATSDFETCLKYFRLSAPATYLVAVQSRGWSVPSEIVVLSLNLKVHFSSLLMEVGQERGPTGD